MTAAIKLSSPATGEFWEVPVLFEDEHLLAVNKPSGLLTSPDSVDPARPNLMTLLHAGIAAGKPWATQRGLAYLMNVHRLDPEVSGVLLLARNKTVFAQLSNLFGSEKPAGKYIALVAGAPGSERFDVNARLAPHPSRPEITQVAARRGKNARTAFEVIEQFASHTLLRCEPLTARRHQIRAHLKHAGFPLVGDTLYGGRLLLLSRLKPGYHLKRGREERPLIGSPALHLERMEFAHPVTGATIAITAEWPKDLLVAVKYLRRFSGETPQKGVSPDNL